MSALPEAQLPLFGPVVQRTPAVQPIRALCPHCLRVVIRATTVGGRLVLAELSEWEPRALCPSCLYTRNAHPGRPVSCPRCRDAGVVGTPRPPGALLAVDAFSNEVIGARILDPDTERRRGESLHALHVCRGDD
ncbi:MAG: hypothetical protein M3065_21790 [Actinomycetota bacterium]|nr:hypothetical protein [Actinomycetota bacterium]